MREGIVDFEKIKILRQQAAKSQDIKIKKLVQQLEQHLQSFNAEREFKKEKLQADIEKGNKIVDELSDKLQK